HRPAGRAARVPRPLQPDGEHAAAAALDLLGAVRRDLRPPRPCARARAGRRPAARGGAGLMRAAFVTNLCTHYRRPLFEELSGRLDVDFYLTSKGNEWYTLAEYRGGD